MACFVKTSRSSGENPFSLKCCDVLSTGKDCCQVCLPIAANHCLRLDQPRIFTNQQAEPEFESHPIKTVFPIRILICTLVSTIVSSEARLLQSYIRPWSDKLGREPPSIMIPTTQMIENGWCPFCIHPILAQFSYQALYYLAQIQSRGGRKADHSACRNKRRCIGNSIPDEYFKSRHIYGRSGPSEDLCLEVPSPIRDVERLIQQGKISLMSWVGSKLTSLRLGLAFVEPRLCMCGLTVSASGNS